MMLKTYKIEINPTEQQIVKIEKTIGTCRFIYNFYISHNKKLYENGSNFISGIDFSKWINNTFLKENPDYLWIKDVSSKELLNNLL